VDKKRLISNFSKHAHLYDSYAVVQNTAAQRLIDFLVRQNFSNILELGCGTGNYTSLLRERFAGAKLKALDFSPDMIKIARQKLKDKNVELIVADAESFSLRGPFDCITSNACFQWLEDLGSALTKYKTLLSSGGVLSFSLFGPGTFRELGSSLKQLLKDASFAASHFISPDDARLLLDKGFKQVNVQQIWYVEEFRGLTALLEKIKYSGIRGNGLYKKRIFTAGILKELEAIYLREFKQIKASYEILLCRGIK